MFRVWKGGISLARGYLLIIAMFDINMAQGPKKLALVMDSGVTSTRGNVRLSPAAYMCPSRRCRSCVVTRDAAIVSKMVGGNEERRARTSGSTISP
jgi:hypothetical protein